MNFTVGIIIGLLIGGVFGFMTSTLCIASENYDKAEELQRMSYELYNTDTVDKALSNNIKTDYNQTSKLYNQRKDV